MQKAEAQKNQARHQPYAGQGRAAPAPQTRLARLAAMIDDGPAMAAQRRLAAMAHDAAPRQREIPAVAGRTGLPAQLRTGIESLSGLSMHDVSVHYNSGKPAQLNALAYAQGSEIHLAPGQERHLPHEAWHVVQQRQGRVNATTRVNAVGVNDDARLEREADVMGARSSAFSSDGQTLQPRAAGLPSSGASGTVQRAVVVNAVKLDARTDIDQLYREIGKAVNIPVPYSSSHFFQSLRLRDEWSKRPIQIKQVLRTWVRAPDNRPTATRERGSAAALTRDYASYVDLATAVLGEADALAQIEKEEGEASQIMASETVKGDLVTFVKTELNAYLMRTEPEGLNQNLMQLLQDKKGDYLPHMGAGLTTISAVLDAPDEHTTGMLIAAIHDITNILFKSDVPAVKEIVTIPPERMVGSVAEVNQGRFSIERRPYEMKDWRGKAATPKVDSKPVETAYVLNTPVSMGPSNTTGRLMMLANASNASTVSRESLAWGLFAFWYKEYRRELTDIHPQHFVLDMAANFNVGYDPLRPQVPDRLLPILVKAERHAGQGGTFRQLPPVEQTMLTKKVIGLLQSGTVEEDRLSKIEAASISHLYEQRRSELVSAAMGQGWSQGELTEQLVSWYEQVRLP